MDEDIREAVDALVRAFGEGRMEDYFCRFHPEATFVFHTAPDRLASVDEYRARWGTWVKESGLRIRACRTSDTLVQRIAFDVAIVSHSVETEISTDEGPESLRERETIVFQRQASGEWLAVHEHLSPWTS